MATPHSSLTATREAPDHSEQYATFAIRSKIERGTRGKERGGEGKEKDEEGGERGENEDGERRGEERMEIGGKERGGRKGEEGEGG